MIKWIKTLLRIVKMYDAHRFSLRSELLAVEKIMKARTDISVDVGLRGEHQIIIAGRYKNADFVETYYIQNTGLHNLISHLRNLEKLGTVKRLDAPTAIRAVIKREL